MDPLSLIAAAAIGLVIGQGNHQMDGYRDTGCDPAHQVAVTSERTGKVLYWNNPTCPAGSGATDAVAVPAASPARVSAPFRTSGSPFSREDDNGDDNGNGAGNGNGDDNSNGATKPEGPRGNASANNGKGGNYAWTGHADNERGNGRNRP